jgi:hypothetical protein
LEQEEQVVLPLAQLHQEVLEGQAILLTLLRYMLEAVMVVEILPTHQLHRAVLL